MTQRRFSGAFPKLLTVLILIGLMTTSTANAATLAPAPHLKVASSTVYMHGQSTLTVPVLLDNDGASLSTIIFTLQYDNTCLAFDSVTDSNNDGLPDAVTPHVPANILTWLRPTGPGEVTMIVTSPWSFPLLIVGIYNDDPLVDIEFDVLPGCGNVVGTPKPINFSFPIASFGNISGQREAGTTVPGIYTLYFNAAPSAIGLTSTSVNENQAPDTVVGVLSTTDLDVALLASVPGLDEAHTYSLANNGCSAPPYNGNSMFWTDGDKLKTNALFDFETVPSYDICVRSTDNFGLFKDHSFTITVNNVSEIADIQLSNDSPPGEYHVQEGKPVGYEIGQFNTIDYGQSNTYSYSLPNGGCGGVPNHNTSFKIANVDKLQTNAVFSHRLQSIYNICVRTEDQADNTNFLERTFTILVDNINEAPVAVDDYSALQPLVVKNGTTTPIFVLENDTDPDGDALAVDSVTGVGGVIITKKPFWIDFEPFSDARGLVSFQYKAKDNATVPLASNQVTVTVYRIGNDNRGDCNHDGFVDAGDLTATVLEIQDDDTGKIEWWYTHLGTFAGSALGCDSNGLRNGSDPDTLQESVDAADLTCTTRIFFGATCGGAAIATATPGATPTLHVADGLQVAVGQTVVAPVVLDTSGQNVAALAFTLNFDPAILGLDPADADSDGIADAVSLNVPAGMAKIVTIDAEAGRIQVALFGVSLPMPLLQDGVIASIDLQAKTDVAQGTSTLELTRVSLGDDLGQSVSVIAGGNNVVIGAGGSGDQLFLPQIHTTSD